MKNTLIKPVSAGFLFGTCFSIIAYLGDFPIDSFLLWFIPFIAALLSGLGTITGGFVHYSLTSKAIATGGKAEAIGFIFAAIINFLIVLVLLAFLGQTQLHRGTTLAILLGLAMGAIYALYTYRISLLQEKMTFLQALADQNKRLQEASRKLAITEERNRMSRELHDSVSQGLHGLTFTIHSLRNELNHPTQNVSDMLSHMENTAHSTLDELRTMIEELKPSLLASEGIEEALRVTANLFSQRQNIPIDIQVQSPDFLSAETEMTVYRITQEALSNIEKHASAKHASLSLSIEDEVLLLKITDDGKGFDTDTSPSGNGLSNIRQRVEALGGSLVITSKIGFGTSIIAAFPLKG